MNQKAIAPENNLDFIRTVLAIGVLSFHTFQILGITYPQLPWVTCFIAISGYLITDSMYRSSGYAQFAWKRLLRIGPAFGLSFVLLWATGGSIPDALTDWIFMGLRNGGSNPPLWSLSLEEVLYFLLAVCFAVGMYRTRSRAELGLRGVYLLATLWSCFAPDAAMPILTNALAFVSGSFLYMVRDRVPWSAAGAAVCLVAVLLLRNTPIAGDVSYALLIGPPTAFFLLTLGLHARPVFAQYKSRIGDPSLGIYVYHFPILMWLYTRVGINGGLLYPLTLALTIPLALISWHIVEKRALAAKNAMPLS
jgi:peptidoglycan/LPS O-acetylase OafA/YrhL